MRAIAVIPGRQGSVELTDMPEPPPDDGPILVETRAIGICGTDLEIINGEYGWAPKTVLITGTRPIGLLAAMLSAQRSYATYVLDRVTERPQTRDGPPPGGGLCP
jgi:threonine dehydrogenase-like Zn-dependent dehydrogenase